MNEFATGFAICLCLTGAALMSLWLHPRLPAAQREEHTHNVIKLTVGMIVVMTSLVLGLLITSVKSTFDGVDRDVHTFATQLILLDRALRFYGPQANPTRALLLTYTERALDGTWPSGGATPVVEDIEAGRMLDAVEISLKRIVPADPSQTQVWNAALARLRKVVELRWTMVEESGATISTPILIMLVGWLTLIFASFGYNAPRNVVVVVTLMLCTTSVAAAVFMIIEMDTPFTGAIRVSPAPIEQAIAYMKR